MAALDDSFTENTFGDLSYTFLEPVPNYLTCIICFGLLKEPVATDCCEKMFCGEHASRTERVCPACRHTPLSVSRNRGFDSIVKDLKVFCLNCKEGCSWSGHLCFEPKHRVDTCDYQSISCEKECGVRVARRLMANHLAKECLLREIDCEFCDYKGTAAEVKFHLETCLEYHIACPHGCELQLPRKDLNVHSSTCPEAPVPCPFAASGCDTMPVKRKELSGHLEASVGAHLLLLASDNQRLSEEVVELRKEREERLKQDRVEAAGLEKMRTELYQVKMELRQMNDKVDRVIKNERSDEMDNWQEKQPAASNKDVSLVLPSYGLDCDDQSEWDDDEIEPFVKRPWVEDIFFASGTVFDGSNLPVVLKYENISSDLLNDRTWTSPQFYDEAGYCMCLHVAPNGLNQASGRFVSVQMQIQADEHDWERDWPYNDLLHVEILNPQANFGHCRKTMDFASFPAECVMEPDDSDWCSDNEPWGILRFLKHSQLHDYILDDTLYFYIKHTWQNDL